MGLRGIPPILTTGIFFTLRKAIPWTPIAPSANCATQLVITKAGYVQLRCLPVNWAHYILGPLGPPCQLRATGERIAAREASPRKARGDRSRPQLDVTLLALWQTGADYQPHPLA